MADAQTKSTNIRDMEKMSDENVTLTVCDRETGERRSCTLEDAKQWDWKNPEVWRMIGGWQITSYASLVHVVKMKIENGHKEVEILEAPRFTMLSGG